MHVDLLGRHATPSELSFFVPQMGGAQQRQAVALAIASSGEYDARVVRNAFLRFLHRLPQANEVQTFVTALLQGGTDEEVYSLLVGSGEYCSGNALPAPLTFFVPVAAPVLNDVTIVVPPESNRTPPSQLTPIEAAAAASLRTLQTQTLAQGDTILSLVHESFGLAADANAAGAARDVAEAQLSAAIAAAGPRDPQVRLAQLKFTTALSEVGAGQYDAAVRDFREVYMAAQRARR